MLEVGDLVLCTASDSHMYSDYGYEGIMQKGRIDRVSVADCGDVAVSVDGHHDFESVSENCCWLNEDFLKKLKVRS